jgi:hypothetical protein
MKNLVEDRMNDNGLRILSEQEIADSSKRKPILERIREAMARIGGAKEQEFEAQKYTKPKLRESIKNRILRGDKGGRSGQWSARKSQLLVQAYEKAGGGYKGGKSKSQEGLKKWGKEKWTTSDGKPSLRKGRDKRYLPERVWKNLKPAEKAAANRAKAEGGKKGKQFVPNTPAVKKVFSYNGSVIELREK